MPCCLSSSHLLTRFQAPCLVHLRWCSTQHVGWKSRSYHSRFGAWLFSVLHVLRCSHTRGLCLALCPSLQWHPTRAFVAMCGRRHAVYLWSKHIAEDWTAFAPNVRKLDRNVEYKEREDEFDMVPCDICVLWITTSHTLTGGTYALRASSSDDRGGVTHEQ